jgi:transcriptional regulator with XRE-family HTH domain
LRRLRVKEVAQEKGFSMAKLQRAADINLKTMQAIWHNPQHDASLKTLDKIAKALGVPITALIEDVPDE